MSPEKKIIILLIAGLVCLEAGVRLAEPKLSADLAHIRTFSSLAKELREKKDQPSPGPSVLVMGNSLARSGVDKIGLARGLIKDTGASPVVVSMTPDATGIAEWNWGFRRYVEHPGARPDLVILVTGRTHLIDPSHFQLPRLGAFYVDRRDRLDFARDQLDGIEDRANFFLSSYSRLWSDRGRVRPLFFYRVVPGYEEASNRINIALGGGITSTNVDSTEKDISIQTETNLLAQLIASVRRTGAELMVVSVPLPEPYSLPDPVVQTLKAEGISVLPLGEMRLLPEERFPDGYHLDEKGADLVTKAIVEWLAVSG